MGGVQCFGKTRKLRGRESIQPSDEAKYGHKRKHDTRCVSCHAKRAAAKLLFDHFFLRGLGLQACVGSGSKLLLELVDSTRRVNELQLSGVKRMAFAANVDLQLRPNAAGFERRAATAGHGRGLVFRVNSVFHFGWLFSRWCGIVGFVQRLLRDCTPKPVNFSRLNRVLPSFSAKPEKRAAEAQSTRTNQNPDRVDLRNYRLLIAGRRATRGFMQLLDGGHAYSRTVSKLKQET